MIEIRPIRENELEPFLRLLCDVFDLDFDRALPLFTSDPLYERERVWGLFEAGRIVSCLTTRPLEFGWGRAIGIAGVATDLSRRGEGLAAKLMERVLRESERAGEGPALLFAQRTELYDRLGFEPLDRVVRARVKTTGDHPTPAIEGHSPSFDDIRARYDAWAARSPERLRRDDRRWRYWQWRYRTVIAAGEEGKGYATVEADVVREALGPGLERGLPVPTDTEALALTYVIDRLELPFEPLAVELYLLGRNVPGLVQMFLTDQF